MSVSDRDAGAVVTGVGVGAGWEGMYDVVEADEDVPGMLKVKSLRGPVCSRAFSSCRRVTSSRRSG